MFCPYRHTLSLLNTPWTEDKVTVTSYYYFLKKTLLNTEIRKHRKQIKFCFSVVYVLSFFSCTNDREKFETQTKPTVYRLSHEIYIHFIKKYIILNQKVWQSYFEMLDYLFPGHCTICYRLGLYSRLVSGSWLYFVFRLCRYGMLSGNVWRRTRQREKMMILKFFLTLCNTSG